MPPDSGTLTAAAFRTRGGPRHGWGNVYRLAAVAAELRARFATECTFVVEGPPAVADVLAARGFRVVRLPDDVSVVDEAAAWTEAFAAPLPLIVVEMLECAVERQRMLAGFCGRLAVFDDLLDQTYDADLVVCGQELPGTGNIDLSAARTEFLVGYDHFMAAPAVSARAGTRPLPRASVERVLVAFGGGAYDTAYVKAAAAARLAFPKSEIEVVAGPSLTDALAAAVRARDSKARLTGPCDDMDARLFDCDVAVVGGGYLKLEAAIVGTPAVMVSTQWHQIPIAQAFHDRTGMPYCGHMPYVAIDDIRAALAPLADPDHRARLARGASEQVDGRGLERVVARLAELVSR